MNHLIRIEKEVKEKGVSCYRILGLNIFSANTSQHDPALLQMQDVPVSKFLGSLSSLYETICLLGSPAPNNWINQMRREGETVTIEGFLGRETSYCQVPISYYGGSFRAQQDYGPSLLFKLAGPEMLKKLTNVFLAWDAVALLMYVKGKDKLISAQDALTEFTTQRNLVKALLLETRYLVLTQADCQYLEIYTGTDDVDNELNQARVDAEVYVKGTAWYHANQANLVWDDMELCYVKR